jgi:hypothetical protein
VGSGGAPWWLSIVTALVAGGFTLLGVRLTQRHAAEQRRLDRLEDHRVEQREALVEVLVTGRDYARSMRDFANHHAVYEPSENQFRTREELRRTLRERADPPAVAAYRHNYRAHRQALLTARLLVRDPTVLDYVTRMSLDLDELPEPFVELMTSAQGNQGRADQEVIERAFDAEPKYAKVLDELERLTRERVVDDPQDVRRRWWQRGRLAWPGRRKAALPDAGTQAD